MTVEVRHRSSKGVTVKHLIKRIANWLVSAVIGVVFIFGTLLLLAEWLSGCGEHYIDSKGNTIVNQCTIIKPHKTT